MSSPTLRVLVVSENRELLRQTSRFLNMFGYRVLQVAGTQHAAAALEGERPHVMILDATTDAGVIHWLCEQGLKADGSSYMYTLLLTDQTSSRGLADAMAAGVDDFLHMPLVFGELLTRLRGAARTVELERRIRQQEGVDSLTGLPNREAFSLRLRRRPKDTASLACVVADLDLLGRVNHRYGRATGDEVIRAVADELAAVCNDEVALASFGGGRFAALLDSTSPAAAEAWAERAKQKIAERAIAPGDKLLGITASFGVATGSAEQLVHSAEEALRTAKHSGRDCVVCQGQFDDEARAWTELATPGKLFEQTVARHVMAPLPVILQCHDSAARAAALLDSTRLDALVVVDSEGRLAGLIAAESDLADPKATLSEILDADVGTFNEDTPLADLLEYFTQDSPSRAVITHRGHPTGLVTREQLATLGEAVTVDRFAPGKPCSPRSDYLVVLDRALDGSTW